MTQWSTLVGDRLSLELGSDDSTRLYTASRRAEAVLEGEREFARMTNCLIRESTITCSNGVQEYDLLSTVNIAGGDYRMPAPQQPEFAHVSSNSTAVGSTTHVAGEEFQKTDIQRLNREEPGWRNSTGSQTPTHWYLRADGARMYLGLYPLPAFNSSETARVRWPYVARPTQSTISTGSTTEPFSFGGSSVRSDLRDYHQAVVHYGAHVLLKARKAHSDADAQLQKFLGYVASYVQAQRDQAGTRISSAREYYREASRRGVNDRRLIDPRRY